METQQREIMKTTPLCDASGALNPDAIGWSRRPWHHCNLRGRFPRKKKWDYWCVVGDRFLLSATIAHIDYLALGSVYFLKYDGGRGVEETSVAVFPKAPHMPETVGGSVEFQRGNLHLAFEPVDGGLVLNLRPGNLGGKPFEARIEISRPPNQECLNVVVPWDRRHFQFTSKQQCLPAVGAVVWGEERFDFMPGAFACLDYGRGVWPYRCAWNWAAFSGCSGDDQIGMNMGAKWTDGTGANENGILLNGRLHKIHEDILFDYDDKDFMRPWRMTSATSEAVRLTFTPFHERMGAVNLGIIRSKTHQLFGRFSGTLRVDGACIVVDHSIGWAEEHRARW